jgi:hypothetical protein
MMSQSASRARVDDNVFRKVVSSGVGLGDQHLGKYSAGAFTRNFGQGIVGSLRLTEQNDSGISRTVTISQPIRPAICRSSRS